MPHLTNTGGSVPDDIGSFRIDVSIAHAARPGARAAVSALLVDTGSELSWIPAEILESLGVERLKTLRFRQATGEIVERWTGVAMLYADETVTVDEIVFARPSDLSLLGSRTLEGLNRMVDPVRKRLVDAGALPAAMLVVAAIVPVRRVWATDCSATLREEG